MSENQKLETIYLGWLDPRTNKINPAGVAFYNSKFGEYFLKIDEDSGRQFFLKPYSTENDITRYRMEMVLKKSDGTFLRRQQVGSGYSSPSTENNIHVDYGSKFKALVVFSKKIND